MALITGFASIECKKNIDLWQFKKLQNCINKWNRWKKNRQLNSKLSVFTRAFNPSSQHVTGCGCWEVTLVQALQFWWLIGVWKTSVYSVPFSPFFVLQSDEMNWRMWSLARSNIQSPPKNSTPIKKQKNRSGGLVVCDALGAVNTHQKCDSVPNTINKKKPSNWVPLPERPDPGRAALARKSPYFFQTVTLQCVCARVFAYLCACVLYTLGMNHTSLRFFLPFHSLWLSLPWPTLSSSGVD